MTSSPEPASDDHLDRKQSVPPKWYRLYYLLVAFDVFTVSMSLYLNHRIMQIYIHSVEVNHAWVERLLETSKLWQLAADVNAPPNDVFQSHKVEDESAKMRAALQLFDTRLEAVREELQTHVESAQAAPLLSNLETAQQAMKEMCREADQLFDHLKSNRTTEAGESMATMDRHYARVNQALERLRQDIADIQKDHFNTQTAAAGLLQWFQRIIAGLILVMIAAAAIYGHKIRKQVEKDSREKEGYIVALRRSEASLDLRVRERTAELVQANETLQKEIAERRRAEEALRDSEGRHRRLIESTAQVRQQLLRKIMTAQEDERRRIARDLHDEIGQALTSLLIGLRTVNEAPNLETAQGRAEDLRRITVATLDEVRRLARGLRPSVLDDLGLTAALERYATDYSQSHGIAVAVEVPGLDSARLPEEVETALYRIIQEALSNTAKHAAAKNVRITVEQQRAFVQVVIEDDGCGFEEGKTNGDGRLGLSGMRERASLLSGSVTIASQPEHGTSITVRIPLTAR